MDEISYYWGNGRVQGDFNGNGSRGCLKSTNEIRPNMENKIKYERHHILFESCSTFMRLPKLTLLTLPLLFVIFIYRAHSIVNVVELESEVYKIEVAGEYCGISFTNGSVVFYDTSANYISTAHANIGELDGFYIIPYANVFIVDKYKYSSGDTLWDKIKNLFQGPSRLEIWNISTGKIAYSHEYHGIGLKYAYNDKINILAFIAYYKKRFFLYIVNIMTGELLSKWPVQSIQDIAFDGSTLYQLSYKSVRVYEIEKGIKAKRKNIYPFDFYLRDDFIFDYFDESGKQIIAINNALDTAMGPINLFRNELMYDQSITLYKNHNPRSGRIYYYYPTNRLYINEGWKNLIIVDYNYNTIDTICFSEFEKPNNISNVIPVGPSKCISWLASGDGKGNKVVFYDLEDLSQ